MLRLLINAFILSITFVYISNASSILLDDEKGAVHATNRTQVPDITYIVDAVTSYNDAVATYGTDEQKIAETFAALYQGKHNSSRWNVVIGYSIAVVHSKIYVEISVPSSGKKLTKSMKDKSKGNFAMIFSAN